MLGHSRKHHIIEGHFPEPVLYYLLAHTTKTLAEPAQPHRGSGMYYEKYSQSGGCNLEYSQRQLWRDYSSSSVVQYGGYLCHRRTVGSLNELRIARWIAPLTPKKTMELISCNASCCGLCESRAVCVRLPYLCNHSLYISVCGLLFPL